MVYNYLLRLSFKPNRIHTFVHYIMHRILSTFCIYHVSSIACFMDIHLILPTSSYTLSNSSDTHLLCTFQSPTIDSHFKFSFYLSKPHSIWPTFILTTTNHILPLCKLAIFKIESPL